MSFITFLVFGVLVGWLTSLIAKTDSRQGLVGDFLLGAIGAVAGGFLMNTFGQPGVTGFNIYSIIVAILGAIVVIMLGRVFLRIIS